MPYLLVLLDLITLIIFCEVYRLWSSLLCSFLILPVTSSLIGSNIVLSALFWKGVGIAQSVQRLRSRVLFPARVRLFYNSQRPDRFWGPRSPLSNGRKGRFLRGVKPETDHSPAPNGEVKNCGAIKVKGKVVPEFNQGTRFHTHTKQSYMKN
jgi:hypothetical protein